MRHGDIKTRRIAPRRSLEATIRLRNVSPASDFRDAIRCIRRRIFPPSLLLSH